MPNKLFIEEGRYKNIPAYQRLCPLCKIEVESEFHFLMSCASFNNQRLFQDLNAIVPSLLLMNDICKFKFILSSKDYDLNDMCINFVNDLFEEITALNVAVLANNFNRN